MFVKEKNKLWIKNGAQKVLIETWGKDSFRVRAYEQANLPSENWALLPDQEEVQATVSVGEKEARFENGKITAMVGRYGKICFLNQKGEVLLEEFERNRREFTMEPGLKVTGFASALDVKARDFEPILRGDYHLKMRFESNVEEKLYGMGQYQQSFLNIKGCELELAQRNSQASVPFVMSSLGYGFLWNNPAVGTVNFSKNITTWEALSTKVLDYFITAGDTPKDIQENYAKATGTVPMMPEYGLGFWQCKLRYQTQEELLTVAREYKKRQIPISVIVIDFFHWTMQGEWEFDLKYWPDPEAMVQELKELGIELMVSIWPTVDHRSKYYEEMNEKGLLIRVDRGHPIAMNFQGDTIHFDPTNPESRAFVWDKAKKNYYDKGIKLFWLDEAEPEYTYYDFDLYRYHLGPNVQIGNAYPLMYAQTFFEGMEAEGQKNIINLLRCAWAGSQKYGALVWSGDIDSSFRSLRNQFAAGLNMGIAGIPWWTTDIGGFHGGDIESESFKEVMIRWFQYGTFCPVMRLHGVRDPQQVALDTVSGKGVGGGACNSGADNEIWSYGEAAYVIFKKYIQIRENLKPYLRELMNQSHQKNTPIMRPLFFDFPADVTAWEVEDQYMFGSDILVAPIMDQGVLSRSVYLPQGTSFIHAWSQNVYEGGQWIQIEAPIQEIPVFIRQKDRFHLLSCFTNLA